MEIKEFKPTDKLVAPIDSLTKIVFSGAEYGKTLDVCEKKRHKISKNECKDIYSTCTLFFVPPKALAGDNLKPTPLNAFDRAVYSAIVSEKCKGNNVMTVGSLYRFVSGKASGDVQGLYESQFDMIMNSLKKLMSVRISVDNEEAYEILKYKGGGKFNNRSLLIKSQIISPLEGRLNGQPATLFYMPNDCEPFLYHFANKKRQLITVDRKLLDTGRLQNSADTISVKFYTLCRVLEKRLTPTIRLEDVYEKCGLNFKECKSPAAVSRKKKITRAVIEAVMENLKTAEKISSYEWVLKDGEFYSVKFEKTKKKQSKRK